MPLDDLKEKVASLDREMSERTTEIVNLERRVGVLEQDVKTLVFLCHYIRGFSNPPQGPGPAESFEKFNVAFSELMQRYQVPYP
jgi:hypothetical protein